MRKAEFLAQDKAVLSRVFTTPSGLGRASHTYFKPRYDWGFKGASELSSYIIPVDERGCAVGLVPGTSAPCFVGGECATN
jgi:hypothetical protein